ncbi:MAG: Fatty acid desaturase [bacterium ADurb.Bin429]|nr:MAG: Fatty acid desaturase [bacterium ADurb.Bin429]
MSSTSDARINWYHSPIERKVLQRLTARSDWRGLRQVVPQLALAVATGAGAYYVARHFPWPAAAAVCYVHATIYAFLGLGGAGHELSHGTPFKTKWLNEFFMMLVAFLTWTNYIHFRASHRKHHQYTVHAGLDMEVVLPLQLRRFDWLFAFTANPFMLYHVLTTTARHSLGIIKGEWEERIFPESDTQGRRQLAIWARTLLIGHLLLAGAFIYFQQWILLALVTFAPFYAGWLNFLCGFTQHVGMMPNVPDFRCCCRSVALNPLLRFLYWNMNYHVEHHMYAAVPFHHLPHLRAAIAHDLPPASPGLIAAWREILAVLRRQQADPSAVVVAQLPDMKVPEG